MTLPSCFANRPQALPMEVQRNAAVARMRTKAWARSSSCSFSTVANSAGLPRWTQVYFNIRDVEIYIF